MRGHGCTIGSVRSPGSDQIFPELESLESLERNEPEIRLVCNVEASLVTTPQEIRSALTRQVSGSGFIDLIDLRTCRIV